MKFKSTPPVGALHPILFFAGVYFVSLVFAIFICSSIFYSCNTASEPSFSSDSGVKTETVAKTEAPPANIN